MPCPTPRTERRPLANLPFLAHRVAHSFEFPRHGFVGHHDVVESVGDLSLQPGPIGGQAYGEITIPRRRQGLEQAPWLKTMIPIGAVWLNPASGHGHVGSLRGTCGGDGR